MRFRWAWLPLNREVRIIPIPAVPSGSCHNVRLTILGVQMISRRYFLQATAVSTAALSSIATAEESSIDCKPLPPAIAKLSSLKDQAQSITAQERGDRQEKARRLMRTNGIDAVLLMSGTS